MDAAADYAAAARALANHFPAFVSYSVHSHVVAGPLDKDEVVTIVVRASDGKIVRGKAPSIQLGTDSKYDSDVVKHPPFDPACYAATGARDATFDGAAVESLALENICKKQNPSDGDFTTLDIDPRSHDPLVARGGNHDEHVAVHVEERFARAGGYLMPAAFDVRVKGSGMMFWLDITAHQTFDAFKFGVMPPE